MAPMDRKALWQRLSERPRNVRFEEIDQLLRLSGWELNNVRGSHHVYRSPAGSHLSIPRGKRPVNVVYAKRVLAETWEPEND